MKYSTLTLFLALLSHTSTCCTAFNSSPLRSVEKPKISSTELNIIGPMIRKMREEKAQKSMPMATEEERAGEAPGLRVGDDAWKWPPVWPYDADFFTPKDDIKELPQASPISGLLGNMNMPQLPTEIEEVEDDENKFDVMKYWQEEKGDVTTDMDDEAANSLRQ